MEYKKYTSYKNCDASGYNDLCATTCVTSRVTICAIAYLMCNDLKTL
jgi:hypothetical protein